MRTVSVVTTSGGTSSVGGSSSGSLSRPASSSEEATLSSMIESDRSGSPKSRGLVVFGLMGVAGGFNGASFSVKNKL